MKIARSGYVHLVVEHESTPIEDLIVEVLERPPFERSSHLDALCSKHAPLADDLRARVHALRAHGLLDLSGPEEPEEAPEFPERLGDFRLIERLGAGGMGVVYLAEQLSLGRRVALKLIRPEQLYFPAARRRFQREVEAVARLSHPAIVPVYTVGEANGIPYFAMEYVDGISLADALAKLDGRAPQELSGRVLWELARAGGGSVEVSPAPPPLFAGNWYETATRIALEVAGALIHSHERGVLHRDVKPSNVMITAEGKVLLVDFGLASSGAKDEAVTHSGGRLGSLPYMAPEQVDGRHEAIDVRTDVYNLGATFYELLALHRPFPHKLESELARAIVDGDVAPLRKVIPAASRDLETVCAKALDSDRARRYASAADFARDLDNLLCRRPVEARRVTPILRVWRWTQRNPGWAAAAALALFAATVGPTVFALQQRTALARVRSQRERAESVLSKALDAVDLLAEIGTERLERVPLADVERRAILQEALGFYRSFLVEGAGNERLERELTDAGLRVGQLELTLGDPVAARAALEGSSERLARLVLPVAPLFEARLAALQGQVSTVLGEADRASREFQRARALLSPLARTASAHDLEQDEELIEVRRLLADTEARLGQHLLGTERGNEALALLDEACARVASIEVSDHPQLRAVDARLFGRRGDVELALDHFDDARASFEHALAIMGYGEQAVGPALTEGEEGDPALASPVLQARTALAKLHIESDNQLEAARHCEEGLRVARAVRARHPGYVWIRSSFVELTSNLALTYQKRGQLDDALPLMEQALNEARAILALEPSARTHAGTLGSIAGNVATAYFLRGDWAASAELYQEAIPHLAAAVGTGAVEPDQRVQLMRLRLNLAWAWMHLGEHERVEPLLDQVPMPPEAGEREPLFAAYLLGHCADLAEADDELSDERREELGVHYIQRALEFLERAVDYAENKPSCARSSRWSVTTRCAICRASRSYSSHLMVEARVNSRAANRSSHVGWAPVPATRHRRGRSCPKPRPEPASSRGRRRVPR